MRWLRYIAIGLLALLLVLVRAFEEQLFYDPFIKYFKADYLNASPPSFDAFKLVLHHLFRFGLNTMLSIAILKLFFVKQSIVKPAFILFTLAFLLLMPIYLFALKHWLENNYLPVFYLRRFLIQPLLLFVFLFAFYYQAKKAK